jgi:hypothetical protein
MYYFYSSFFFILCCVSCKSDRDGYIDLVYKESGFYRRANINTSIDCRSPDKSRTLSWVHPLTVFALDSRYTDSFYSVCIQSCRWMLQSWGNTCSQVEFSCFLSLHSIFQETIHDWFYRRCLVVRFPDF